MSRRKNHRTAWMIAISALTVVILLVVLSVDYENRQTQPSITLPEPLPAPEQKDPAALPVETLEVGRENVQKVIGSLARPQAYHQTLWIETVSDGMEGGRTADIWVRGSCMRVTVTDDYDTRTCLTDGKLLYIWYDGDEPVQIDWNESFTMDDLAGIPSYESVLSLSPEKILGACYVTLDDDGGTDCIYVNYESEINSQFFWVNTETGLLFRQNMLEDGELVYSAEQKALTVLAETDASLNDCFLLPDGSAPFD